MLTGCANFTPDGGMSAVQVAASSALAKEVGRIRSDEEAAAVQARVRSLLVSPLNVERAVQVALLNNRGLQAAFAELAASEAEQVEASLPDSPTLSLTRLAGPISGTGFGSALEIERQLLVNVLRLFTLPRRREIAELRFEQAKLRAVETVLRTAAEVRRAYFRAVASAQLITSFEEAKLAAEANAEVVKRLGETGALSKLQQARQHAFYADLGAQLATAKLRHAADRERLIRLMGLWGKETKIKLPSKLPRLPSRIKRLHDIEAEAIDTRIDLHIARVELDTLAKVYGLTRSTRFINVLEVAAMSKFECEEVTTPRPPPEEADIERTKTRWHGFELEIQIPIFDLGEARTRRAEETYRRAVHRLAAHAINIRSEVRQAYGGYSGSYDIAKLYENEVLPLRKIILDEGLLRYNAMVTDLTDLLVDARARAVSNVAAIEAQRDFFLAETDLKFAILGGGGLGDGPEMARAAAADTEAPGH